MEPYKQLYYNILIYRTPLLLVPPEALHRFTVGTRTGFVFIRFTGSYIAESLGTFVEQALLASATPCITPEGGNAAAVQALVGMLTAEPEAADGFSSTLRQQLVGSIVTLAARSVLHRSATPLPAPPEGDKDARLVAYIQRNIHRPERLKTEALCDIFHISPGYMGRYFKRRFHESLREYIAGSRIRAAAEMLCNSRMSVKEIAYRLGYTDSCHLVRSFKHHYGTTPASYRSRHASGQETR